MERYLTFNASFQNEDNTRRAATLFENFKERVRTVDEAIKNDNSNSHTCFQTYFPEAKALATEFIDEVGSVLQKPWQAGIDIDDYVVREIARGLDAVITTEKTVQIEIFVSGYDREIVKLLLPLFSVLGAVSASASGTNDEDFDNIENYELKNGDIHYECTAG